jgi:hypothetical protein
MPLRSTRGAPPIPRNSLFAPSRADLESGLRSELRTVLSRTSLPTPATRSPVVGGSGTVYLAEPDADA